MYIYIDACVRSSVGKQKNSETTYCAVIGHISRLYTAVCSIKSCVINVTDINNVNVGHYIRCHLNQKSNSRGQLVILCSLPLYRPHNFDLRLKKKRLMKNVEGVHLS